MDNTTSFSEMEISAIGEILNISMGSAATAISKMLDKRVDITTPEVSLKLANEITLEELEPAVGVQITYVEGIFGNNVMVLRKADVNSILNIMTGGVMGASPDDELDEMGLSAICEVMNQMMGASATALADFLGRSVNISTPTPVEISFGEPFLSNPPEEQMVVVNFSLLIENVVNSRFLSVMTAELARDMLQSFSLGDSEPAEPTEPTAVSAPEPIPAEPTTAAAPKPMPVQPKPQAAPPKPAAPKVLAKEAIEYSEARPVVLQNFDEPENYFLDEEQPENLDLIRSVPLEISVEIGKAVRKVKEILEFVPGTVIELDKQAGAPVNIIVNGQPIAKGDVVVIGDNFGVRIVEILKREELLKL